MNDEGRMQNGEAEKPQVTAVATIDYANRQGHPRFAWLGKASCWCFVLTMVAGSLCVAAAYGSVNKNDYASTIGWALLVVATFFIFSLIGVAVAIAALVQRVQVAYAFLGLSLNLIPLLSTASILTNRL